MASNFGSSGEDEVFSSINVTPLVDVVLVLLIIFMITAPAIYQSAIKVHLPPAKSGEASDTPPPLSFVISKEGELSWNKEAITWEALNQRLSEQAKLFSSSGVEPTVLISADQATPHGTVIRLMDVLRESGLTHFGISVQTVQKP